MLQLYGDTPKDLPMETFIDVILKFAKDLQVSLRLKFRQIKILILKPEN
jgi:hypothetical protein